jgi:hypothetical protein
VDRHLPCSRSPGASRLERVFENAQGAGIHSRVLRVATRLDTPNTTLPSITPYLTSFLCTGYGQAWRSAERHLNDARPRSSSLGMRNRAICPPCNGPSSLLHMFLAA